MRKSYVHISINNFLSGEQKLSIDTGINLNGNLDPCSQDYTSLSFTDLIYKGGEGTASCFQDKTVPTASILFLRGFKSGFPAAVRMIPPFLKALIRK